MPRQYFQGFICSRQLCSSHVSLYVFYKMMTLLSSVSLFQHEVLYAGIHVGPLCYPFGSYNVPAVCCAARNKVNFLPQNQKPYAHKTGTANLLNFLTI